MADENCLPLDKLGALSLSNGQAGRLQTMAMKPLIYLILGAAGSGRREIVADLIAGGLGEGDRALVLISEGETPDASGAPPGPAQRWRWNGGRIEFSPFGAATHVFLIADGRRNPVDQIEAVQAVASGERRGTRGHRVRRQLRAGCATP